MAKTPAWSYTSLTTFETCPKRYYLTRVTKEVKEPPSEAMTWGNTVHKALELRIKDKTPLPAVMQDYEKYCASIEASPGRVFTETQYALNAKFERTGWFDKDVWCRGVVDVGVINGKKAAALDWKTGKVKEDSKQMMLFAGFILHTEPEVETVSTGFIWLKHNKVNKETYTREQLPEIWQEFLPRVRRLEVAYEQNKWEAKPSGLCRAWCPVGKSLCDHCGT